MTNKSAKTAAGSDKEEAAPTAAAVAAATDKAPEPGAEKKTTGKTKAVTAIAIRALGGGFRRAGYAFGKEAAHFALDFFTEKQAELLRAEPKLNCDVVEVDPAEVTVRQRPEADDTGK